MASILQILRRIGGTKAAPTKGQVGQLALWKAGTAPTDVRTLYVHDGVQWVELIDTSVLQDILRRIAVLEAKP